MKFGQTLQNAIYSPWRDQYVDYARLKLLLREDEPVESTRPWTDEDESAFVEELLNTQLDKISTFQSQTYADLRRRTQDCESRLQESAQHEQIVRELDAITAEISELERYSRVNYTGLLKAAKKHDRKRGLAYKVRPLLQVRLAAVPFNAEDYSPLLYEISEMYATARQTSRSDSVSSRSTTRDNYDSHKFWVHTDNLFEVKTSILRHLPILVYSGISADPTISSLYFDNSTFQLYNHKLDHARDASTLRLRWFGPLEQAEIGLEKKTVHANGDSDEIRVPLKRKHLQSFLDGQYHLEKVIGRIHDGQGEARAAAMKRDVDDIQAFIRDFDLKPVLRATYKRMAFQIPGNDAVRISLDTDVTMMRENSTENELQFPHALLEIKIRRSASRNVIRWLDHLMSSHLVQPAPKFSKFVHGIAQLFEDYVNSFPFWLSTLETDIRKDPEQAEVKVSPQRIESPAVDTDISNGSKSIEETKTRTTPLDSQSISAKKPKAGSLSKYARAHRQQAVQLPPGVRHPGVLIKDRTSVKVEPKVWLANQRTFIKWQHISVLLASLSLALYNATAAHDFAQGLAVVYTLVALFAGAWGWIVYIRRSRMIEARSGRDFDNVFGPVVVCLGLVVALCLNFIFKVGVMSKSHR